MSDRDSLVVEPRSIAEEKAKQLRREGWIPGVIYGQDDNLLIKVENLSLRRVLRSAGSANLIDVSLGKSNHTVLAKDIQVHPTRGDLIHIDFYEVNMAEKLVVEASLIAVGIAAPAAEGLGTTTLVLHSVEIECLPDKLISEIEVDLSLIENPDDTIQISDLEVPQGVEILGDPDSVVASFDYLLAEVEEEEEEEDLLFAPAADDVEVISKGKKEEEDEESV